jgi:hypothetical protein
MAELFDEYKYAYYYALRREARSRVVNSLNARIKTPQHRDTWKAITLASIKRDAIDYAQFKWSKYYNGETHSSLPVSWERLYFAYSSKLAHFNVAVWQNLPEPDGNVLRGMAFGKPSSGKTHLTINWLERSPEPNYFKGGVLLPILSCAEEYAKLLGCERVLIKDPLNPGEFEKYGYVHSEKVPKGATYVAKELEP